MGNRLLDVLGPELASRPINFELLRVLGVGHLVALDRIVGGFRVVVVGRIVFGGRSILVGRGGGTRPGARGTTVVPDNPGDRGGQPPSAGRANLDVHRELLLPCWPDMGSPCS